jgi:Thrombospondin type 3 repeat
MTIKAAKSSSGMRRIVAGALALTGVAVGTSGCIEDSDCGICDPDNLVLESISGINYASRKIHVLGPECEGGDCPGNINSGTYFIEEIGPCEQTEEALESPRGVEEFCKISPLVTAFGIEFVFNNLLDPTSIELVRKRPDNPQLFEVYDWKHQILEIEGPITRYNGDFVKGATEQPDVITRLINLSCIDNLAAEGTGFTHEDYQDPATNPCNEVGPNGLPRKMQEVGTFKSYPGRWTAGSNSCDTPDEGPDTCCSRCDFLLTNAVAKYGLTEPAEPGSSYAEIANTLRNPNTGTAILCDPAGDVFQQCAGFVPWVDRSEQEIPYQYFWDCDPAVDPSCEPQPFGAPYFDRLRETFPTERPAHLEKQAPSCSSTTQCRSVEQHGLPGTDCVGATAEGIACNPEVDPEGCTNGRCVAEWFVTCRSNPDTLGDPDPTTETIEGYCADQRFSDAGAPACVVTRDDPASNNQRPTPGDPGTFPVAPAPDATCDSPTDPTCLTAPNLTRLSYCDWNEDGTLVASECCQPTLQTSTGGFAESCDPLFQDLQPVVVYDRNDTLPEQTKDCICVPDRSFGQLAALDDSDGATEQQYGTYAQCKEAWRIGCFDAEELAQEGDAARVRPEREDQYAVKFVSRVGGVIYDPAIKGFEWRPADVGGVPRADIEACAEARGLIDDLNRIDGWRANDAFAPENVEDFDRGLCSGSEYTVSFQVPEDGGQYVQDKVGNTLAGKSTYRFETPEFHVEPGSGFPSDNLRIGACNDFSIRFSNKYDMSPENLSKIEMWRIDPMRAYPDDFIEIVAGGSDCAQTQEALDAGEAPVPCLTTDIGNQAIGEVGVEIDPTVFGPVLQTGATYRLWVPGLGSRAEMNDAAAYRSAFWDVCGMPLVTGGASEADFLYDFTVDQPKCKEDQDLDNVQLSCDNAPDFFNPDQGDIDRDGFGDVIDRCPTLPGTSDDTADSDNDGVGNTCDTCRQASRQYNEDDAGAMGYMTVRNVPFQDDADADGIGDVCDNCVLTANCQDYDASNPWELGDPIEYDDDVLCLLDANNDMVGDACEGQTINAFAAGPVSLGPDDDFDQDGLANLVDACPRQPLVLTAEEHAAIACTTDDDCASGKCEVAAGICDHLDTDRDGVGDVCDTCPFTENPLQVADGAMQEGDDTDGDFVGNACETAPSCEKRLDPRPFSFYEYAANGYCCTVALFEDDMGNLQVNLPPRNDGVPQLPKALLDPDGRPVRVECSDEEEEAGTCRKLPSTVAVQPGVLTPPPGCEAVLGDVDPRENPKLSEADFEGDLLALWDNICFLPQFDQDYDGLGDKCDLCEFDFDPENLPFIDANGRVWPNDGKFCNGDYSIDNKPACLEEDPEPTGGETEGTGGETTGGETTGGGATTGG